MATASESALLGIVIRNDVDEVLLQKWRSGRTETELVIPLAPLSTSTDLSSQTVRSLSKQGLTADYEGEIGVASRVFPRSHEHYGKEVSYVEVRAKEGFPADFDSPAFVGWEWHGELPRLRDVTLYPLLGGPGCINPDYVLFRGS